MRCHNSSFCFCKEHVNKPNKYDEKYISQFLWIKISLLRLEELNHRICPNINFINLSNILYSVILLYIIDLVVIYFLLLQYVFYLQRTHLVQTDIIVLYCSCSQCIVILNYLLLRDFYHAEMTILRPFGLPPTLKTWMQMEKSVTFAMLLRNSPAMGNPQNGLEMMIC